MKIFSFARLPRWHSGKKMSANAEDMALIPGSGRSPEEEWLFIPCLENSMDRGDWKAMVHGLQRVRHN